MSVFQYAHKEDESGCVHYYEYKTKYWVGDVDRFVLCWYPPSEALRRGYLHPYQELTSV